MEDLLESDYRERTAPLIAEGTCITSRDRTACQGVRGEAGYLKWVSCRSNGQLDHSVILGWVGQSNANYHSVGGWISQAKIHQFSSEKGRILQNFHKFSTKLQVGSVGRSKFSPNFGPQIHVLGHFSP